MDIVTPFIITGILLGAVASVVRSVPTGNAAVVNRFGKFHRVLLPGFHYWLPLADRFVGYMRIFPDPLTSPVVDLVTRDGRSLPILVSVTVRAVAIDNLALQRPGFAQDVDAMLPGLLTELVSRHDWDDFQVDAFGPLQDEFKQMLIDRVDDWGVEVGQVSLMVRRVKERHRPAERRSVRKDQGDVPDSHQVVEDPASVDMDDTRRANNSD